MRSRDSCLQKTHPGSKKQELRKFWEKRRLLILSLRSPHAFLLWSNILCACLKRPFTTLAKHHNTASENWCLIHDDNILEFKALMKAHIFFCKQFQWWEDWAVRKGIVLKHIRSRMSCLTCGGQPFIYHHLQRHGYGETEHWSWTGFKKNRNLLRYPHTILSQYHQLTDWHKTHPEIEKKGCFTNARFQWWFYLDEHLWQVSSNICGKFRRAPKLVERGKKIFDENSS